MDLLQNPFYILSATVWDNSGKIIELAEERSLMMDPNECSQAKLDLTNPRKRLSAEIAWLPGLGPKRVTEILALLDNSVNDLLGTIKLTSIAKANLLAAGLSRLKALSNPKESAKWIYKLTLAFEDIIPEDLCTIINEDRAVSGFPKVADISAVEAEIQSRRLYFRQVIKSALKNLKQKDLVKVVTAIVEFSTNKGEKQCPILIDDLVDS